MFIRSVELSIAAIGIGGAIALVIQASKPDSPPGWGVATVLFAAAGIAALVHATWTAITQHSFNKRIVDYIAEAQALIANKSYDTIYKTTTEYQSAMLYWSDKVAEDIRKHKSASDALLFLDQLGTQGTFSLMDAEPDPMKRHWAAIIASIRLEHLKDLQKNVP